jgi:hypothetical protein
MVELGTRRTTERVRAGNSPPKVARAVFLSRPETAPKATLEGRKMKAKIAKRVVQSLEPNVKSYKVVDTEIAGFILRVQPSCSMNYYVSYSRPDRRRNRVRLGLHLQKLFRLCRHVIRHEQF